MEIPGETVLDPCAQETAEEVTYTHMNMLITYTHVGQVSECLCLEDVTENVISSAYVHANLDLHSH